MTAELRRAYTDMWEILQGLREEDRNKLPQKLQDFIRDCRDPDYQSTVNHEIPLGRQDLSDETRTLSAMIYLSYWVRSAAERRELAETMRRNDGILEPYTDEEYHRFLEESLSSFNDFFGPMPFWEESMGRA